VALSLEQKKIIVGEVAAVAADAHSAIAADYRGMTVEQFTELRAKARDGGVYLRVVKNTLARRALDDTEFACMNEQLVGPMLLAFSMEDPGSAARLFKDFGKQSDQLKVKVLALGGQVFPETELDRLASLPNREQALSMLMGVMKAPIEKFVRTMAEPHAKLVRTIAAVRDQKEAA
jgi:large subunit ribosomal protein L10